MSAPIPCFSTQKSDHPIVDSLVRAGMRQPGDTSKLGSGNLVINVNGYNFHLSKNCAGFELKVYGELNPRFTLCRQSGAGDEEYSLDDLKTIADLINEVSGGGVSSAGLAHLPCVGGVTSR